MPCVGAPKNFYFEGTLLQVIDHVCSAPGSRWALSALCASRSASFVGMSLFVSKWKRWGCGVVVGVLCAAHSAVVTTPMVGVAEFWMGRGEGALPQWGTLGGAVCYTQCVCCAVYLQLDDDRGANHWHQPKAPERPPDWSFWNNYGSFRDTFAPERDQPVGEVAVVVVARLGLGLQRLCGRSPPCLLCVPHTAWPIVWPWL